ncbi:MAG: hypothetical protein H5T85_01630 [Actinobacteria bacterium]|nr:hypothetical protein [Actinomycetota bacterium]
MPEERKIDGKDIGFIVGGAIVGAIAGYMIKKIGIKNIINLLKAKDIISPTIANLINEFTTKEKSEE